MYSTYWLDSAYGGILENVERVRRTFGQIRAKLSIVRGVKMFGTADGLLGPDVSIFPAGSILANDRVSCSNKTLKSTKGTQLGCASVRPVTDTKVLA